MAHVEIWFFSAAYKKIAKKANTYDLALNPFSAGTVFIRQNVTYKDDHLTNWNIYNDCRPIT